MDSKSLLKRPPGVLASALNRDLKPNVFSAPTSDPLQILDQICTCLEKNVELLEKVRNWKEQLNVINRSKSFSSSEVKMIQRNFYRHLWDFIVQAYKTRHEDLSQVIKTKYLEPEAEKTLCENQNNLYELVCQYQKTLQ
jgi:hypothetical protein